MTTSFNSTPSIQITPEGVERMQAFQRTRHFGDIARGQLFAEQILALHLDPAIHDTRDEATLGEYLAALLNQYLFEGEGFDPKRPFGNSDWGYAIDAALNDANIPPKVLYEAIRDVLTGGPVQRAAQKYLNRFEALFAERINAVIEAFEEFDPDVHDIQDIQESVYAALGLVEVDEEEDQAA